MAGANTTQVADALRARPSDRRVGPRRTVDLTGWARVLADGIRDAEQADRRVPPRRGHPMTELVQVRPGGSTAMWVAGPVLRAGRKCFNADGQPTTAGQATQRFVVRRTTGNRLSVFDRLHPISAENPWVVGSQTADAAAAIDDRLAREDSF